MDAQSLGRWLELERGCPSSPPKRHKDGYSIDTFTAYADDVAALERVDDPAVPAGRAYPGAVVGGSRSDRVKAMVHIAAPAPDERDVVAH